MARLLVVSRSMALALRLADAHEVSEHPADDVEKLVPDPGIDVMVLDVGDPSVATGVLERLRARGSTTPVLVVSGYQPEWADLMALDREDVVVVPLPITRAALLDGIERLSSPGSGLDTALRSAQGAPPAGPVPDGPVVALADRATSGERQRAPESFPSDSFLSALSAQAAQAAQAAQTAQAAQSPPSFPLPEQPPQGQPPHAPGQPGQGPGAPGVPSPPPTPDVLRLESLISGTSSGRLLPDRAAGDQGSEREEQPVPPGGAHPFGSPGAAGQQPSWPGDFVSTGRGADPSGQPPDQDRQEHPSDSEQGHRFRPWRRSRKDEHEADAAAPTQGPPDFPAEARHARNGGAEAVPPLPLRPLPTRPTAGEHEPSAGQSPLGKQGSASAAHGPVITASLARPRAPYGPGGEDFDWWIPSPEEIIAAQEQQAALVPPAPPAPPLQPRQPVQPASPVQPAQPAPDDFRSAAPGVAPQAARIPPAEAPTVVLPLLIEGADGRFVPGPGQGAGSAPTAGQIPTEVSGGTGSAEVAGSSNDTQPSGIPLQGTSFPLPGQGNALDLSGEARAPQPAGTDGFPGQPGPFPGRTDPFPERTAPAAPQASRTSGWDSSESRDDGSPVPSVLLPSASLPPAGAPSPESAPSPEPTAFPDDDLPPLPRRKIPPPGQIPGPEARPSPAASPQIPQIPQVPEVPQDPEPASSEQPVFIDTRPASTRGLGPVESQDSSELPPRPTDPSTAPASGAPSWSFGSPTPAAAAEPSLFEPALRPADQHEEQPQQFEERSSSSPGSSAEETASAAQGLTQGLAQGLGMSRGPSPRNGPDVPPEDPAIAIARRKALHERVGQFDGESPQSSGDARSPAGSGPGVPGVPGPQPTTGPTAGPTADEPVTEAISLPAIAFDPFGGPVDRLPSAGSGNIPDAADALDRPPGQVTFPDTTPFPDAAPFPDTTPPDLAGPKTAGPDAAAPHSTVSDSGHTDSGHTDRDLGSAHDAAQQSPGAENRTADTADTAAAAAADTAAEDHLPTLVRELLEHVPDLFGVRDAAQVLAEELRDRAEAEAVAVLVPDNGVWRVDGGVGLRPAERRMPLESGHWLVTEAVAQGRPVLLADTDQVRRRLANAPLSTWHRLMAVPFPTVHAVALLARGHDAPSFEESDVRTVAAAIEEATSLFRTAMDVRDLARKLSTFQDGSGNS
ncbi:MAG: hypothetical protein QG608_2685 [Actinomycetota bacterium]|nr:hypothetical protein [Actinomycetota bacterium]